MDGGEKQDDMARRFKAQVKQGKERRREREYVRVLDIEHDVKNESTASRCMHVHNSHTGNHTRQWTFDEIPASRVFQEFDVDFTMLYVDHVFPFLFPFYTPPMIQGGRAWVLDNLRNKTLFQAVMSLSAFFFTLILSSEDVSGHEACRRNTWIRLEVYVDAAIKSLRDEVRAISQQRSKATLLQQAHTMESITQLMILETGMAKTAELNLHLAAATSLVEDMVESRKTHGSADIRRVIAGLETPPGTPLVTDRPVWNTDQAAFRFFLAVLLWADIVSCTSLQTVPRLWKHLPNLICCEHGGAATEPLLRMEEYVGCEGWALSAIAETAALDLWKREEQAKGTLTADALASRGDQLYRALEDGLIGLEERCAKQKREPRGILLTFYQSSDTNQAARRAAATRIWAYAARIYLTVVTVGWQPQHPAIRESVDEVLRLLQELESPAVLRSSVWPFCVAGCLAEANQEQDFRDLTAASGPLQSFGLVGESLRILEHVWSRRGKLSVDWDLAACFRIMGAPVLLL
jgi:hypothetical protein